VKAEQADPRDGRWEESGSTYRVRFWEVKTETRTDPPLVYESAEVDVSEVAGVSEALRWAEDNADGRTFTLYALVDRGPDRGLVHLEGADPTRHD
jgi:hypothetical protein